MNGFAHQSGLNLHQPPSICIIFYLSSATYLFIRTFCVRVRQSALLSRIGRAKQKIQETTGSALSTTYSSEYFEQIALLEATRKQTATMVTAFDEMFNAYATDNRFECIGDVCNAFGNRLPPSDSRNTLVAVKKALDLVGLAHRTLYRNVTEHVVRPLRKWRKVD